MPYVGYVTIAMVRPEEVLCLVPQREPESDFSLSQQNDYPRETISSEVATARHLLTGGLNLVQSSNICFSELSVCRFCSTGSHEEHRTGFLFHLQLRVVLLILDLLVPSAGAAGTMYLPSHASLEVRS